MISWRRVARLVEVGRNESRLREEIRKRGTLIAGLIDPEDFTPKGAATVAETIQAAGGSLILVGGSTAANQKQLDDEQQQQELEGPYEKPI